MIRKSRSLFIFEQRLIKTILFQVVVAKNNQIRKLLQRILLIQQFQFLSFEQMIKVVINNSMHRSLNHEI